jgi:hypothetical protein
MKGSEMREQRAERDETLKVTAVSTQTIIAINAGRGLYTARTPKLVATPLPPLNDMKTEKMCPSTTVNPTSPSQTSLL